MINFLTNNKFVLMLMPKWLQRSFGNIDTASIGHRFARGSFWLLLGASASRILALISSIMVARLLGKEVFGELGVIQSTVGMFAVFAGLGMGMTATKYIADYRHSQPTRVGHIIALTSTVSLCASFLISLLIIFIAPWLAQNILGARIYPPC